MLPGDRFVPGLASFLVGQLLFAVGFFLHPGGRRRRTRSVWCSSESSVGGSSAGSSVRSSVPVTGRWSRRSSPTSSPSRRWWSARSGAANAAAIAGALLFFASDGLIGETRFVAPRRYAPVAIMVTYHLALAALVVSLV